MKTAWWVLLAVVLAWMPGCGGSAGVTITGHAELECETDCVVGKIYTATITVESNTAAMVELQLYSFPIALLGFSSARSGPYLATFVEPHDVGRGSTQFAIFYQCSDAGMEGISIELHDRDEVYALGGQQITCRSDMPGIRVTGSGGPIADGGSDDAGTQLEGAAVVRAYTVKNDGMGPLTLGTATMGALTNCTGSVTKQPAATLAPGASDTMTVTITPSGPGPFSCKWALPNNDTENPYDVEIKGNVAASDLDVTIGAVHIADGGSSSIGNSVQAGTPISLTYGLDNLGTAAVTINSVTFGTLVNCTISITTSPAPTLIPPNTMNATTMVLSITPTAAGPFSAPVIIATSATNTTENPYNFTISGMAIAPPEIDVDGFADGAMDDAGNALVGQSFSRSYGINNLGGVNLTISNVVPGTGTNCTIVVFTAPTMTVAPMAATAVTMRVTASAPGPFSCPFQILSNDADEAMYDLAITGTGIAPEIVIDGPAGTIVDGSTDDAGSSHPATVAFTRMYSIFNTGTANLVITGPVVATNLANCTVTITQPALTSIPAGGSTTFTVQVTPGSPGQFGFDLAVPNSDTSESSYDITVFGSAGVAPQPALRVSRSGLDIANMGGDPLGSRSSTAPIEVDYTITNDGTANLDVTSVTAPPFQWMNTSATVSGGTGTIAPGGTATFHITIQPSNPGAWAFIVNVATNDQNYQPSFTFVVSGDVQLPAEIDILGFADGGMDPVGAIPVGLSVTRSYTVKNLGPGPLTLGATTFTNNNSVCSVAMPAPAMSLPPMATTTLKISAAPDQAGQFACTLHLANDDGDENPYDITITGNGTVSIGNFAQMLGNYFGDNGCGIQSWSLEDVGGLRVDSFGSNPDDFPITVGADPNVASGTGFVIFGVPNHPCTFTKQGNFTIIIQCNSPSGGSCTETASKL